MIKAVCTVLQVHRQVERQTNRLTDRQVGRQADIPADRQTDRQTDREACRMELAVNSSRNREKMHFLGSSHKNEKTKNKIFTSLVFSFFRFLSREKRENGFGQNALHTMPPELFEISC